MFLQEKVSDINKKLKTLTSISNIVIWGAGIHTCKLFEYTEIHFYNVKNIVDIDEKKHGKFYFGFTVQSPEEMSWSDVGAVVISVSGKESQIMDMLMNHLGFAGQVVTLYENSERTPFYLLYDEKIPAVQYFGDYYNWSDAYKECKGYEDTEILNTVINAVSKVVKGDAVWERDGYLFYEQKYVYCICAAILKCAVQNQNRGVRVLDIGGSLGSTYWQNKAYLSDVKNLEYIIAEQDHFADYGYQNLEDGVLRFIKSTDNWEEQGGYDIVLLSNSLQYISQYQDIISKIIVAHPHYIILDRIMIGNHMRIYKSSYPMMIFTEQQIRNFFEPEYKMVEWDTSSVPTNAYFMEETADSRYYVFECKNNI